MSHQPFETWVLDQAQLTLEERRTLQAHLDGCKQCQRLERKWQAVHQELRARPMIAPAPGFTQRWQASLAERRAREQRRQAWKIFGFFLAGATLILFLMAGYALATTSPAEWLVSLVSTLSSSHVLLQMVVYAVQNWITKTPLALNIALWIYLTLTLCGLSVIWVVILWRTKTVGVHNQ